MEITLKKRTAEHVAIYWHKTQNEQIKAMLPSAADSLEKALSMFEQSQEPKANSFGQVIYADGQYVGDIWCYCIDEQEEKSAMLSFCIFEPSLWSKGIATEAIRQFLSMAFSLYHIEKMGAFTYADNFGSIKALQKAGFTVMEEFVEDGRASCYLEYKRTYNLRPLSIDDYDAFSALMQQLHCLHVEHRPDMYVPREQLYSLQDFEKMVSSEEHIAIGAEKDGRLAGICVLTLKKRNFMVKEISAYMEELVVEEKLRHQGIATALFHEAERISREKGAKRLDLMVWDFNKSAKSLYEQLGMTPQRYIYEKKL